MTANDLVIGAFYLYEGMPVRLVSTRCFETHEGHKTQAIIETAEYPFLWVKPEELQPCDDLQKEIDVC